MESFFSAHDRIRADLPKIERAKVLQVIMGAAPGGVPVPPPSVSPVMFQSFKRDGNLEWQLQANDDWVAVNCLSYSRWDAIYKQARSFLEFGFHALGNSRPDVTNVALQFIDTFVWEAPTEDYEIDQLINRDSGYFPNRFQPDGPSWHFHEGQFEQFADSGARLLNRTHIDAIVRDGRPEVRVDTTLRLDVAKPVLETGSNLEDALNSFEGLHARNKEILSQVISTAMQERVSLHGGRSE
jgi:uncharacterized protein (TIGR04255 family)